MAIPKISLESITNFFNGRNAREKTMLVVFGICFIITADVLLVIQPLVRSFMNAQPESNSLKEELKGLEQDVKNEKRIEVQWKQLNERTEALNKKFVNSIETSAETLSKFAQESGVKISSQTPDEKLKDIAADSYAQMSIKVSAASGAHELGRFLAKVENSPIFFRVSSLAITENNADTRNHPIEMKIECYRKI